jgi:hypothetical protein
MEKVIRSRLERAAAPASSSSARCFGIACRIDDERYCIDVLTQLRARAGGPWQGRAGDPARPSAARRDAFHGGSAKERQTKIEELLEVLDKRG